VATYTQHRAVQGGCRTARLLPATDRRSLGLRAVFVVGTALGRGQRCPAGTRKAWKGAFVLRGFGWLPPRRSSRRGSRMAQASLSPLISSPHSDGDTCSGGLSGQRPLSPVLTHIEIGSNPRRSAKARAHSSGLSRSRSRDSRRLLLGETEIGEYRFQRCVFLRQALADLGAGHEVVRPEILLHVGFPFRALRRLAQRALPPRGLGG
jgi:hypothetical protein